MRGMCGALPVIAGCLGLLCPETHNRPLPETIEDVENMSKSLDRSHKQSSSKHLETLAEIPIDATWKIHCISMKNKLIIRLGLTQEIGSAHEKGTILLPGPATVPILWNDSTKSKLQTPRKKS